MVQAQLTISGLKNPALFIKCSFEADSTMERKVTNTEEQYMKRMVGEFMAGGVTSAEEFEQRERSSEDKALTRKLILETKTSPATPAVVIGDGRCAMIRWEIKYSLGAGALVTAEGNNVYEELKKTMQIVAKEKVDSTKFNELKDHINNEISNHMGQPLLFMKGCKITNCGGAASEARQHGNLILEDCELHDNDVGVLAWNGAADVIVRGCTVANNKREGIHGGSADYSYDNPTRISVEQSTIHHNQIGLSLEYMKGISVRNCEIFSNRSWGIYLRNSTITSITGNDIFRNDCGGIKVCLNRFNYTVVMKNIIHDHTGPDIIQTAFLRESQEEMMHRIQASLQRGGIQIPSLLNREDNSVPIMVMDNVSYNNQLSYGSIEDWNVPFEKPCNFCNDPKAKLHCKRCRKVKYCSERCLNKDKFTHETFCAYFTEIHIIKLSVTPMDIRPANQLIEDRTTKKKLKDYRGKEFLIKITAGPDHFGFDPKLIRKNMKEYEAPFSHNPSADEMWLYDEFRFVCGVAKNKKIEEIVRQFGKLTGEKTFTKQIFLHARMLRANKNELQVRTDHLLHDQGW